LKIERHIRLVIPFAAKERTGSKETDSSRLACAWWIGNAAGG
jgi:hypothetical protein